MTISLRISDTDAQLIRAFANYKNVNVSTYIRELIMNDIEKEYANVMKYYFELPED